ncbi:DUF1056 family protein [Pediococcus pentosaceus]|uniref:DUF1056 family protein n=1 Tax=Pediococcus pentosaceus TaxID=1255 RepID=UPI000C07BB03|nr:DUF1056 family protein [Pediococcus pentosaceus]
MIFRTVLRQIGKYFDILCFILALIIADYAAFMAGKLWGLIAVALTIAIIGWLSEVISGAKGGE